MLFIEGMDINTIIRNEEKSLLAEYPLELSQEPDLIVSIIGGESLPFSIKPDIFATEDGSARKTVAYTTRKEYLPLRKEHKTDEIYEFLQPDQTFVRVEWLNKVRHAIPSVVVIFETPETLFRPDHDAVPQLEMIHSNLSTRRIKMIVTIVTHSPQTLIASDSYNSFRKRLDVEGLYLFNLSDVKNALDSLSKTVTELAFQHYKELEVAFKDRAQTTKMPWRAATSYFKAAFMSEVREPTPDNCRSTVKLYTKAFVSSVELLKVEEQRFYKSSNVLATKELINWLLFRICSIYERLSMFSEMITFFNQFIPTCLRYVGIPEFKGTHDRWIGRQYQLIASIYDRNKLGAVDSLFHSYSAATFYGSAYYQINKVYSSAAGREFIKYLPSKCTPDFYFDCAMRQYYYSLQKISVCCIF